MADAVHTTSRRSLLGATPFVLATSAFVSAVPLSATVVTTDPWVTFGAAFLRHRDAVDVSPTDEEADRQMDLWGDAQRSLEASSPTTIAGVVAGLTVASADLDQFYIEDRENVCPGILFVKAMMDGAIAALKRLPA